MGNKVKYNLKNVHAAKMTETDQEGTPSFSMKRHRPFRGQSVSVWMQKGNPARSMQMVLCISVLSQTRIQW